MTPSSLDVPVAWSLRWKVLSLAPAPSSWSSSPSGASLPRSQAYARWTRFFQADRQRLDGRAPVRHLRASRWARSASGCACSARTRSIARSRAEPSFWRAPRAQPPRAPAPPSATSSDERMPTPRPRASRASTTTPPRPCCSDGVVVAAARRSASRASATTRTSPRAPSSTACSEAGITPEQLDSVGFYDKPLLKFERMLIHLRRDLPALVRLVPQGDPALAAGEALGAVDHPQGAQALQGPDPVRRAPHEPRGLLLPALALRGGRDPHRRRRRRVGDRDASASAAAATSSSSRRSASRTRSACSTAPSPTTSASRSTAPSTR